MTAWNAEAYLRFSDERTQPARDLAARVVVSNPVSVMDLGCGPGNSTAVLAERWPSAEIVGLDSSPEMIEAARKSRPQGKWVLADAATWTADKEYGVVFSNAALQWLPDHAHLFPRLFDQVASGGALAVQVPAHHSSPAHREILQVAEDPAWSHLMDAPRKAITKESPAFYYDVLQPLATRLEIWETDYYHVLDEPRSIIQWFRATGLRPFLSALESQGQRLAFESKLLDGLTRSYPRQKDGRVLFPFRRLFIIAYHP